MRLALKERQKGGEWEGGKGQDGARQKEGSLRRQLAALESR